MRTTLNLPDALLERLRAHARGRGETVTSVVERAIRDALDQHVAPAPTELVDFPVFGSPGGSLLLDLEDPHAADVLDAYDEPLDEFSGSEQRMVAALRAQQAGRRR